MSVKRFPYGGQAVLEGVMMRGLRQASIAVRMPSGEIVFKHHPLNVKRRHLWENLPFLRGVLMLWDALNLGMRALNFSASVAIAEEEKQAAEAKATSSQDLRTPAARGPEAATQSDAVIYATVAVSLLFGIGLFFVLPTFLASLAERFGASPLVREVVKSLIQFGIFIGYIVLIGRLPDIQRVFGYHGAEHKAINAYEAGAPLTVESVREFTLIHPRCGTSFLLVVLIISFVVFLFVRDLPLWARLLSHIPLIPVIAGITYELLRLSAANYHRAWVRKLVAPTLALQRLTTRAPEDSMIAVAIAALLPVLAADGVRPAIYDTALALGVPQPEESVQLNAPGIA
jgi:uncharacterized protein YqhQ